MGRTCIVQLQESEGLSIQWSMVSQRFSNYFTVWTIFLYQVCLVSYACFFSLKWNTQQSLTFGNYNNKLHENTNLGKYESVFSPHF